MKKILLLPLLMMCGVIAVNAQLQHKLHNWAGKEQMEKIEKSSTSFTSKQLTQLEAPVMKTRGIDDYILNPYWMTNNDLSLEIFGGGVNVSNTMDVATYYTPKLVERFSGNKITTIYTAFSKGAISATMWIRKSIDGENLWEKNVTGFATNSIVTVDCDYEIDDEPFFVGYTIKGLFSSASVFFTENFNTPLSMVVGSQGQWQDFSDYGTAFFICETEGEAGLKQNDAGVSQFSVIDRTMTGSEYYAWGQFVNMGYYPILSVKARAIVDNKEYITEIPLDTIPFLGSFDVQVPCIAPSKAGKQACYIQIIEVNGKADDYTADNELGYFPISLDESYPRKIVMEEITGTWCGWCPRGAVAIEKLKEDYPDDFIGIAVHGYAGSTDPFVSDSYAPILDQVSGYPSAIMNRLTSVDPYYGFSDSDYGIKEIAELINKLPTEAQMGVSSTVSEDGSEIEITSYTRFNVSLPEAPYTVAYVLVEDKVMGVQDNYYSSSYASQTGITEESLPEELKVLWNKSSRYTTMFNDIAREIYDAYGIEGSLSGTIESGEVKQHTYTIAVPSSIKNLSNTSVIALLLDAYTGEIIAAEKAMVGEAKLTGIDTMSNSNMNADVKVSAGALIVSATNATANVYTIDGKLIVSRYVNGTASIAMNGLKGTIIVKIEDGKDAYVKKITL